MNFSRMKLGTKLISAFVFVCAIGAVVSGIGIRNMGQISDEGDKVYNLDLIGLSLTQDATINILKAGRALRNAILASSTEQRATFLSESDHDLATARADLDRARPLYWSEKGKALFADLDQSWIGYAQAFKQMQTQIGSTPLQDRSTVTDHLFGDFGQSVNKVDQLANTLVKVKQDNAQAASQANLDLYRSSRDLMVALVLFAALTGVGIGVWLARSLTRQLGTEPGVAADLAKSVAGGDLSVDIRLRHGDTASLMASLKAMRDSLVKLVAEVRGNAEGVASASAQIAQGNLDLSSRTEEQASALQQTAASMEQLSSTVEQNASNAKQANELAMSANLVAVKGGEVVGRVVQTMKSVNDSSQRIVDIIGVIDGIAFQTNILALNAAVEAARAGEQGRGFAVVASEVRSLAQRSAAAAKEIKALISNSAEVVQQGTALVDDAGVTMQEVVASIQRVTDIMGEISAASSEQSIGVAQIGEAVSQMDQVTQQNAALVEQSAAAAESLKGQAQQLVRAVSVFKLAHDDARVVAQDIVLASEVRGARPARLDARAARPGRSLAATLDRRSGAGAKALPQLMRPARADTPAPLGGKDDWQSF